MKQRIEFARSFRKIQLVKIQGTYQTQIINFSQYAVITAQFMILKLIKIRY